MEKDYGRKRRQLIFKEKKISNDEFMAASIGDCEWLDQSLRDGHNPSTFDKHGFAPIHLAALHGKLDCMKLLIEKYGVDVNLASSAGWRPLHFCLNKDSGINAKLCLQYLLSCGADVNCKTFENITLVHQAASEGLIDCLQILLKKHAPVDICDNRGHTPYDLAKLWGYKNCARVIQNEVWIRSKVNEYQECKKLDNLKENYINLQKEALQQLHNEQEFYGNVTYGNWLEEKGYSESPTEVRLFHNERYPDDVVKGLAKRLMVSGGIEDCASRSERLALRLQSNAKPKNMRRKTLKASTSLEPFITTKAVASLTGGLSPHGNQRTNKIKSRFPKMKTRQWNHSTNVNTKPITNIQNKTAMSLSIHPDEDDIAILPLDANLTVQIKKDKNKSVAIKVLLPGGQIQNADIYIPNLSSDVIHNALSGKVKERIKLPQEFNLVHIQDVKHKRRPTSCPPDEISMHLETFVERNLSSCSSEVN
ncbi:ankyrin repeat domain-containing protein 53-like [Clavelina lepadiformis]|uniref:ankyrin repeat domain-containing protein 53-like n=1 Tax=Clavelina lepadiformis TaxID=159417 RepID=UPI004042ED88